MTRITIDRTVVEQALECLNGVARGDYDGNAAEAADAFRAALAEPVQEPVRGSEMRRCPRCWEPMFPPQRKPLSVTDLQQALVETDLIDPDAIDDPEAYDGSMTLAQIDALHQRLTA